MNTTNLSADDVACDAHVLSANVERGLRATGYSALRSVDVIVISGVVVLQGRVPSYHMKQVAQAIVMTVAGVRDVYNELDVANPP